MANKNTLRNRRKARKDGLENKGQAVDSTNDNRFRPRLDASMEKQADEIRKQSRKLYGRIG